MTISKIEPYRPRRSFLWSVLGASVLAAASSCSDVTVHKDSAVPLAQYKTYRWVDQDEAVQLKLTNPTIDYIADAVKVVNNPKLFKKIQPLVDRRFAKDGYQLKTTGTPDFYVSYYGKAKDRDWVSTWSGSTATVNHVPVVIFPHYRDSEVSAFSYRDGTVYLVLYDAQTKAPAWSGAIASTDFGPSFEGPQTVTAIDDLVDQFHAS